MKWQIFKIHKEVHTNFTMITRDIRQTTADIATYKFYACTIVLTR